MKSLIDSTLFEHWTNTSGIKFYVGDKAKLGAFDYVYVIERIDIDNQVLSISNEGVHLAPHSLNLLNQFHKV